MTSPTFPTRGSVAAIYAYDRFTELSRCAPRGRTLRLRGRRCQLRTSRAFLRRTFAISGSRKRLSKIDRLVRESAASLSSACLTLCLPGIEAARPCRPKYRRSHTSDTGARGGLDQSESPLFPHRGFETSSVDMTIRSRETPTIRRALRRRLTPSLRRNRGIALEVETSRT